jgi:hypothetical protein
LLRISWASSSNSSAIRLGLVAVMMQAISHRLRLCGGRALFSLVISKSIDLALVMVFRDVFS